MNVKSTGINRSQMLRFLSVKDSKTHVNIMFFVSAGQQTLQNNQIGAEDQKHFIEKKFRQSLM
jgi:hypothetical protein